AELELGDSKLHQPVTFEGAVTFAGSRLKRVVLKDTEITGWADFSNATFYETLDLRWALFSEDTDFTGASFPDGATLDLEGARFRKTMHISWDQIANAIPRASRGELLMLPEN